MKPINIYLTESLMDEAFIVIKPGFTNISKLIIDKFTENGYNIKELKSKRLLLSEAKKLYKVHKEEDFYEDLCKYMASDVSIGIIIAHESQNNIFENVAKLKDDIRKEYGESDMRNVLHSSDSYDNMVKESSIYFNRL